VSVERKLILFWLLESMSQIIKNFKIFQKFGEKLPFVVLRVAATFYTPSVT
jgi:hypothetical protein